MTTDDRNNDVRIGNIDREFAAVVESLRGKSPQSRRSSRLDCNKGGQGRWANPFEGSCNSKGRPQMESVSVSRTCASATTVKKLCSVVFAFLRPNVHPELRGMKSMSDNPRPLQIPFRQTPAYQWAIEEVLAHWDSGYVPNFDLFDDPHGITPDYASDLYAIAHYRQRSIEEPVTAAPYVAGSAASAGPRLCEALEFSAPGARSATCGAILSLIGRRAMQGFLVVALMITLVAIVTAVIQAQ